MTRPASDFRDDRAAYGRGALWLEPSIWAVAVYRYGRWARSLPGPVRTVVEVGYLFAYSLVRVITGIDIPRSVEIGPGVRIFHFGGIMFSPGVRLGARCRLRHGVTIGVLEPGGPEPTIGDDVFIGAYAQIFGAVTIGDGARIGALSVVLQDVPPGSTVVGAPARIVKQARTEAS